MTAALQLFPALPAAVEAALRASIERFGVLVPVVRDQTGRTLDGHHRARLADELGVSYRVDVVVVKDDDEARQIAATLNVDRRQLDPEQRREIVAALRSDGHSTRAIAGALGVSDVTVRRDLSGATHVAPERVSGVDGKHYPARRPAVVAATTPAEAERVAARLATKEPEPGAVVDAHGFLVHNHRATGTGDNEWYTPAKYVELAREVLGAIDLDPASTPQANETVRAARILTAEEDGLRHEWHGRVWLNPPYSQPSIQYFADKLAAEWAADRVSAAIALTHNYTDTRWWHRLAESANLICFTRGRLAFVDADGRESQPTQGQTFFYFGPDRGGFAKSFRTIGFICTGRGTYAA